jgi:hypothetical protein
VQRRCRWLHRKRGVQERGVHERGVQRGSGIPRWRGGNGSRGMRGRRLSCGGETRRESAEQACARSSLPLEESAEARALRDSSETVTPQVSFFFACFLSCCCLLAVCSAADSHPLRRSRSSQLLLLLLPIFFALMFLLFSLLVMLLIMSSCCRFRISFVP